jgi:hypothetical protein
MSNKTRTRKTRTADTTASATRLRSVPQQETTATIRTDAEDKLWEVLHANPNSTAATLSAAATIAKSTAQKILVKWSADGSVARTAGIAEGGRRAAHLWAIIDSGTATTVDQGDGDQAEDRESEETVQPASSRLEADSAAASNGAESLPDNETTATDAPDDGAEPVDAEPVDDEPVVAEQTTATADDGAATDRANSGAKADTKQDKDRLASGALRGMVEDHLREHPSEEFGPTAIANALGGKSSGAVSNALDKLVADGVAVKTKDKPKRFMLNPAEATAAPAPTN